MAEPNDSRKLLILLAAADARLRTIEDDVRAEQKFTTDQRTLFLSRAAALGRTLRQLRHDIQRETATGHLSILGVMRTLLLTALLMTACTAATTDSARPRILALGDSYTIGETVEPEQRWPNQLARALRAEGVDVADPEIIAKTGWTTDELSSAIDTVSPDGPYDLVTLLIGVNNQYRGRDAEQYRGEFTTLLQRAIAFAGNDPKNVIVVSIPDWGVMPFAAGRDRASIATEIDRYNTINRDETLRSGARYVDVTPTSRQPNPAFVASDGLHPSAVQYTEWMRLVLPEAREAVK
ncbi:MAG TPA: SGNH/GDSL hydrolase family protein [Thermoanaerobaculia bacterium]|jgi:lysophospholipase L1-like esterase